MVACKQPVPVVPIVMLNDLQGVMDVEAGRTATVLAVLTAPASPPSGQWFEEAGRAFSLQDFAYLVGQQASDVNMRLGGVGNKGRPSPRRLLGGASSTPSGLSAHLAVTSVLPRQGYSGQPLAAVSAGETGPGLCAPGGKL